MPNIPGRVKNKIPSINVRGNKVHSNLKCGNKLITIGEGILAHNWTKRFSY